MLATPERQVTGSDMLGLLQSRKRGEEKHSTTSGWKGECQEFSGQRQRKPLKKQKRGKRDHCGLKKALNVRSTIE